MKKPFLGGVLLIVGTTLGVGMLAFPTLSVFGGFFPSVLLFAGIWLLMLASAYFFVDANLSIEGESDMVTMAEKRLGKGGKAIAWVIYLLLLYSLTSAYIDGCTPLIVEGVKALFGVSLPSWFAPLSLPLLFAGFIYFGTSKVDFINRFLMLGLVVSFGLLICFLPPQVDVSKLLHVDFGATLFTLPIAITAFGYHILIPSLSRYFKRDRKMLRKAVFVGSIIPFGVYVLWQFLVLGVIPVDLLAQAYVKGQMATTPLALIVSHPAIKLATKLFSFFAIVTSFIGVTLSLCHFLSDGFKIKKSSIGRLLAVALTFVPPLLFVYTYEEGFYLALKYAGAFVALLLICLPAAMVWRLKNYQTPLRRVLVITVMVLGLGVVLSDLLEESGKLKTLVSQYIQ